jgi:hypothetical protein
MFSNDAILSILIRRLERQLDEAASAGAFFYSPTHVLRDKS